MRHEAPTSFSRDSLFVEQVDSQIHLNNITLTPLAYEHDAKTWEANEAEIVAAMKGADYTIFEYFPPEIEGDNPQYALPSSDSKPNTRGRGDGYHRLYQKEIKPFFGKATAAAATIDNHGVLVLDPAHDLSFAYIHYLFPFPQALELTAAARKWPTNESETTKLLSKLPKVKGITRRNFIKFVLAGSAAFKAADWAQLYIEQALDKPLLANEGSFRRAVVAEGIDKMSRDERYQGASMNLLYPPAHVEGIIQMLHNPIRRKAEILAHKADLLMLIPQLRESLFTIREFHKEAGSEQWRRQRIASI
jgi:hypothetical protein